MLKMVINAPASVRPERLRALLTTVFKLKPTTRAERMDPMFTVRSFQVVPLTFVKAILATNFQMEPLISMLEEVNNINY